MGLAAGTSRPSWTLRRKTLGLLSAFSSDDTQALGLGLPPAAPAAHSLTVTGNVQRPYLCTAGIGAKDLASGHWYGASYDNGGGGSRIFLESDAGQLGTLSVAAVENNLWPTKLVITPASLKVYALGLAAPRITVANPADLNGYVPLTYGRVTDGGSPAPGNRYDCHYQGICWCRDNFLYLENLRLGSSVTLTVNASAPVTLDVDLTGHVVLDFVEAMFPARVRVDCYSQPAASGLRYASTVLARAYGGDVFVGHGGGSNPVIIQYPRYWRILISANNGGGNARLAGLEFRHLVGVADAAAGGTVLFNSQYDAGGFAAANVFDGDLNTAWANDGNTPYPLYLGYLYSLPGRNVRQVWMQAFNNGSYVAGDSPKDFLIQSSVNAGVTWDTALAVTNQTAWTTSQVRTFNLP